VIGSVLAAKRYGVKVIAQVKRQAKTAPLHPKTVVVPGYFVDAIVLCDDPKRSPPVEAVFFFEPRFVANLVIPEAAVKPLPMNMRKVIGRAAR
jgi:propionate CoA-transferase